MVVSPGGRPADASPVGTPGGRQNWVDKAGGLPSYIRMVAHAMIRKGHDESSAIRLAVGIVRNWAEGKGDVSPKVRAAAAKAMLEWEAKRGKAHVDMSTEDGIERGTNALNLRVDVRDIDLSALATGDTSLVAGSTDVDLAPGDYHPPYDWKHGFIPITPAAVRSKRKLGKKTGRAVPPKGVHIAGIGKVRPGQKRKSSTTPGNAAAFDVPASKKIEHAAIMFGTGSPQHKAAQARFGAQAKAEDDVKRGRAVPGAVQAARPPTSATAGKATSSITEGDVIHEPKIIGGGTARLKVDKVYSPDGKTGNRNADVTNMDTGATHAITLDGTKTHQVETTKAASSVSSLADKRATKTAAAPHANPPGGIADRINQQTQADMAQRKRKNLEQRALASGYDPKRVRFDSTDQLEAHLAAKSAGHPHPVGAAVNARQPGIERVTAGRVVGYTDNGMVKVKPHHPADAPVGTFNPSHVARAGQPLRNTPDSRTSGGAAPTMDDGGAKPGQIRVEHGPDGTLVHDTERADAPDLKAAGFKWSRNLNAWYLPRTWGESTRDQRVRQLEAKLGDKVHVDRSTGPRKSAAEREAETRARAADRAGRMDARAASARTEAERRAQASDAAVAGIPFGQPILVGHHSERRHRNAIEKSHTNMRKSVEADQQARDASAAADRARRTASGVESKTTTDNRIKKLEAEQRDIDRRLAGTSTAQFGAAKGAHRDRLEARKVEIADELAHNRGKLEAAGGTHSAATVKPGDFVKIRGQWYPVKKSNAKTVTVPSAMIDGRTDTAPYAGITEHKPASEATREDVARMIQGNSTAFPALRRSLAEAAPPKVDAAPVPPKSGVSATVLPVGAAGDAYAGRGKVDGTGRLSNGGHHSTPPVVITGANGTEYRRDSGGMWHARKPDGSTYEVANQREAKKLDAERARVHAAHNAGPHPEADAAAAAERDRKRKVAEAMRGTAAPASPAADPWAGKTTANKSATDAELKAESERLQNYINGRAGGTASEADVERWRTRKAAIDAMLKTRADKARIDAGAKARSDAVAADRQRLSDTEMARGGISESTARKMSDAQLEDAVRRLMASGTYSGPALGVLEDEMNRRDKARAGKAPRR